MKFLEYTFTVLLACCSLASCIREDFEDCYSTNYLLMSYKGDGTTEIFNDKINRVEMFIFDSQDQCVSSSLLSAGEVESRKVQLPPLAAGDYRIVCVGNTHHTSIRNLPTKVTPYSDITFADNDFWGDNVVSGNDSLYFASIDYDIEEFDAYSEDYVKTMEFRASHYDVSIEVVGVPQSQSLPVIEMRGVLPCTDFENHALGTPMTYVPKADYDGSNVLRSVFNIMRHTDHSAVDVVVCGPQGGDLAKVNLAEFLAAHSEVKCDRQEVMIPIRIEFKSGNVIVSVPDWYITEVKPEF